MERFNIQSPSRRLCRWMMVLCTLCCLLVPAGAQAQTMPVAVNVQMLPPYSAYLADYIIPGSERMKVTLNFNDNNEATWDVRLRLTIEGNGLLLTTAESYNAPMITLNRGPNMLDADDLSGYMSFANMNVVGPITQTDLIRTGKLPEGRYNFCWEVLDYGQRVVLSRKGCTSAMLRQNNPVRYTQPEMDKIVSLSPVPNLQFLWQADHDPSINAIYEIKMVQVPAGVNPNDAFNNANTPWLDWTETTTPSFTYGATQLPLENGTRYAWRIRVRDAAGQAAFENDGVGPVWSFYYGFATGGTLPLSNPENEKTQVSITNFRFDWDGPNNLVSGQTISYRLLMRKMNAGQSATQAMEGQGPYVIDHRTDLIPYHSGYFHDFAGDPQLEPVTKYAWKVEAYTEDIKVAESQAWSFTTRPIFDIIYGAAGARAVTITEITPGFVKVDATHYTNVSGKGTADIGGGVRKEFTFTNIKVAQGGGKWGMTEGQMIAPYDGNIELDFNDNGTGNVKFSALVIDPQDMKTRGKVEWNYPVPVKTPANAKLLSKDTDFIYDNGKINGTAFFPQGATVDLLNPNGFDMVFDSTSQFVVALNEVTLAMTGNVLAPTSIGSMNNNRAQFGFKNVDNPFYFVNDAFVSTNNLTLAKNTRLEIKPQTLVFDFTESKSFGTVDAGWKGVLVKNFQLKVNQAVDQSGQVALDRDYQYEYDGVADPAKVLKIGAQGLTFSVILPFDSVDAEPYYARLVGFKGKLSAMNLNIVDGVMNATEILGFIKIPMFSNTDKFTFSVPLTSNGFGDAVLTGNNLVGKKFTFQGATANATTEMLINQAVIKEKAYLCFNVDFNWLATGVSVTNFSDVRLWGNGDFGAGKNGGTKALETQAYGLLEEKFDLIIDSLGFFSKYNVYNVTYRGNILYPGGLSGEDGTRFVSNIWLTNFYGVTAGGSGKDGEGSTGAIEIPPIEVSFENAACSFFGSVSIVYGDSIWGTKFDGQLDVAMYLPKAFAIGGHLVIGDKNTNGDDYGYFFLRVYAMGLGIGMAPIPVAIDGFDATLYYHMRRTDLDEPEEEPDKKYESVMSDQGTGVTTDESDFPFEPDEATYFGFKALIGFMDAASIPKPDASILVYAGLEAEINTGGLESIGIIGNLYLNANRADPEGTAFIAALGEIVYQPQDAILTASLQVIARLPKGTPKLCADGTLVIRLTETEWSVQMGNVEEPMTFDIGCEEQFPVSAYLGIYPDKLNFGAWVDYELAWRDTLSIPTIAEIEPFVALNVVLGLEAEMTYDPFEMSGTIFGEVMISLGVNIRPTLMPEYNIVIADVYLGGNLTFTAPDICVSGTLYGGVEVLGYGVDFEIGFTSTLEDDGEGGKEIITVPIPMGCAG